MIQSGKEFVSVLRLAQKRASVGDKPDIVGCNGGENWMVSCKATQDFNTLPLLHC